jgi:hypothetical protein
MHQMLVQGWVPVLLAQAPARGPSREEEAALQVEAVAQELALGSALVAVVLELALELVQMN